MAGAVTDSRATSRAATRERAPGRPPIETVTATLASAGSGAPPISAATVPLPTSQVAGLARAETTARLGGGSAGGWYTSTGSPAAALSGGPNALSWMSESTWISPRA